ASEDIAVWYAFGGSMESPSEARRRGWIRRERQDTFECSRIGVRVVGGRDRAVGSLAPAALRRGDEPTLTTGAQCSGVERPPPIFLEDGSSRRGSWRPVRGRLHGRAVRTSGGTRPPSKTSERLKSGPHRAQCRRSTEFDRDSNCGGPNHKLCYESDRLSRRHSGAGP